LARAPRRVNNNFFLKCKNPWVGLKAWNVFAPSPSLNKVFFIVAPWITHSIATPNTPATNFFLFKIFPFLFFSLFNFFAFFLFNFFSYCKEKINWWDFFYIIQKLGDDNLFSFEIELNFLIKTYLFFAFQKCF